MAFPKNVTVFGGSGFLGRYIVGALAARGVQVRVAVRYPDAAVHLKTAGDVGQVTAIRANVGNAASVRNAVEGADAVINLVGILYETGAQKFTGIQAEGAAIVAREAAAAGVPRFIQMSAIGVGEDHDSAYARTKAAGEAAAKKANPDTVVLRPSVVFGPQDDFFNRFADLARKSPVLPLVGGGFTRFQPVYVGDVAAATMAALEDDAACGKTFELGGPDIFSFEEILKLVMHYTGKKRLLIGLPFWLATIQALFMELLPTPPLTRDQLKLLKHDNVVSKGARTLADLGIAPTSVHAVLASYMDIYRDGGRYTEIRRYG